MTGLSADMLPQVSVIIPVFQDDAALTQLLIRLTDMDIAAVYIIDGEGRLACPQALAPSVSRLNKVIWSPAPRGRGPQIAQGLDIAIKDEHGDSIWVLHADSSPHRDACKEITRIMSRPQTSLGMFRLDFGRSHWAYHLFESFGRLDSSLTSFGDQGFFFRRNDAEALWPSLKNDLMKAPILEDMILRRALKSRGGVKKSSVRIATSPRRFERYGLWHTQLKNMMILLSAKFGAEPTQLYDAYYNPAPAPLLRRESLETPYAPPIRS